ncbi:MAG: SAM-dependent methyltransferase [Ruminococcus sp.]|nr:SAM-dependent methyltransferase [Ruminococcus sp.]
MQASINLDTRLSLCADFVRVGAKLADIGTDHAYLPVHLALSGKIEKAIAADINEDPLSRGMQTIGKYNVSHLVSTRLSDGLKAFSSEEVTDIVIAGMGADTIISILANAPWLKDADKRLILQPMTKSERVISYLYENGFEIKEQKCCIAEGKPYTVLCVHFTGHNTPCSEYFSYTGKLCPEEYEEDKIFLKKQISILTKRSAADKRFGELSEKIKERLDNI